MDQIEPNVAGLAVFTAAWAVCCLGGLLVAGMFPLSARPDSARQPAGLALILLDSLVLLALLVVTVAFGFSELRWTSVVVVAGLVFLFIPELFQVVPERWRDGPFGLSAMLLLLVCAFALLHSTGGTALLV